MSSSTSISNWSAVNSSDCIGRTWFNFYWLIHLAILKKQTFSGCRVLCCQTVMCFTSFLWLWQKLLIKDIIVKFVGESFLLPLPRFVAFIRSSIEIKQTHTDENTLRLMKSIHIRSVNILKPLCSRDDLSDEKLGVGGGNHFGPALGSCRLYKSSINCSQATTVKSYLYAY